MARKQLAGARKRAPPEKTATAANVGYEAQLWQMADALRGSMDAAEYKHVCLGLLFLKYISDAFEERHAALLAEQATGADPEDPDEYRAQSIFWVPPEARWPHLKAQARHPQLFRAPRAERVLDHPRWLDDHMLPAAPHHSAHRRRVDGCTARDRHGPGERHHVAGAHRPAVPASHRTRAGGGADESEQRWSMDRLRLCGEHSDPAWWVFPANHPEDAKPIIYRGSPATELELQWGASEFASRFLDRLSITVPDHVPLNAPVRLRAVGLDARGGRVPLTVLRWWTSDSAVATIDSTGTLRPHRTGSVKVFVSAGGWREDSAIITIGPPSATLVLRDSWSDGITPNFIPYGSPRPQVVTAPGGGPAFWNAGDGSFNSGAYSRRLFSASHGLGITLQFSAPITATQWQYVAVEIRSNIDTVAFASWNDTTGSLPTLSSSRFGCALSFPAGEGVGGRYVLTAGSGGVSTNVTVGASLSDGSWHTATVQLLPDGRCAFAVDQKPLIVLDSDIPVDRTYRVNLGGKSKDTRVLYGPVEVWEGVKAGIDWSKAPTPR